MTNHDRLFSRLDQTKMRLLQLQHIQPMRHETLKRPWTSMALDDYEGAWREGKRRLRFVFEGRWEHRLFGRWGISVARFCPLLAYHLECVHVLWDLGYQAQKSHTGINDVRQCLTFDPMCGEMSLQQGLVSRFGVSTATASFLRTRARISSFTSSRMS